MLPKRLGCSLRLQMNHSVFYDPQYKKDNMLLINKILCRQTALTQHIKKRVTSKFSLCADYKYDITDYLVSDSADLFEANAIILNNPCKAMTSTLDRLHDILKLSSKLVCTKKEMHRSLNKMAAFNTLRPRQNCRHFPDDIFKCIFLDETL